MSRLQVTRNDGRDPFEAGRTSLKSGPNESNTMADSERDDWTRAGLTMAPKYPYFRTMHDAWSRDLTQPNHKFDEGFKETATGSRRYDDVQADSRFPDVPEYNSSRSARLPRTEISGPHRSWTDAHRTSQPAGNTLWIPSGVASGRTYFRYVFTPDDVDVEKRRVHEAMVSRDHQSSFFLQRREPEQVLSTSFARERHDTSDLKQPLLQRSESDCSTITDICAKNSGGDVTMSTLDNKDGNKSPGCCMKYPQIMLICISLLLVHLLLIILPVWLLSAGGAPGSIHVHSRVSLPLDELLATVRARRGLLATHDSLLKQVMELWSHGLVEKNYNGRMINRCSTSDVAMNLIDPLNPSSVLVNFDGSFDNNNSVVNGLCMLQPAIHCSEILQRHLCMQVQRVFSEWIDEIYNGDCHVLINSTSSYRSDLIGTINLDEERLISSAISRRLPASETTYGNILRKVQHSAILDDKLSRSSLLTASALQIRGVVRTWVDSTSAYNQPQQRASSPLCNTSDADLGSDVGINEYVNIARPAVSDYVMVSTIIEQGAKLVETTLSGETSQPITSPSSQRTLSEQMSSKTNRKTSIEDANATDMSALFSIVEDTSTAATINLLDELQELTDAYEETISLALSTTTSTEHPRISELVPSDDLFGPGRSFTEGNDKTWIISKAGNPDDHGYHTSEDDVTNNIHLLTSIVVGVQVYRTSNSRGNAIHNQIADNKSTETTLSALYNDDNKNDKNGVTESSFGSSYGDVTDNYEDVTSSLCENGDNCTNDDYDNSQPDEWCTGENTNDTNGVTESSFGSSYGDVNDNDVITSSLCENGDNCTNDDYGNSQPDESYTGENINDTNGVTESSFGSSYGDITDNYEDVTSSLSENGDNSTNDDYGNSQPYESYTGENTNDTNGVTESSFGSSYGVVTVNYDDVTSFLCENGDNCTNDDYGNSQPDESYTGENINDTNGVTESSFGSSYGDVTDNYEDVTSSLSENGDNSTNDDYGNSQPDESYTSENTNDKNGVTESSFGSSFGDITDNYDDVTTSLCGNGDNCTNDNYGNSQPDEWYTGENVNDTNGVTESSFGSSYGDVTDNYEDVTSSLCDTGDNCTNDDSDSPAYNSDTFSNDPTDSFTNTAYAETSANSGFGQNQNSIYIEGSVNGSSLTKLFSTRHASQRVTPSTNPFVQFSAHSQESTVKTATAKQLALPTNFIGSSKLQISSYGYVKMSLPTMSTVIFEQEDSVMDWVSSRRGLLQPHRQKKSR